MVGGYTLDNPLDALIVGYHKGDTLMFSSKLRNGFVPRCGVSLGEVEAPAD